MPLHKSYSPRAFAHNLSVLIDDGYAPRQAIAIAYSTARRALHADGLKESRALRDAYKKAIEKGFASHARHSRR